MTDEQKRALALAAARRRRAEQEPDAFGKPPPEFQMSPAGDYMVDTSRAPKGQGDLWPVEWTVDPRTNQRIAGGFSSDAGLLGMAKRAATMGGEAIRGELDVGPIGSPSQATPETFGRAAEAALLASPMSIKARMDSGLTKSVVRGDVPTQKELLDAGGRGFQEFAESGVQYKIGAIKNFAMKAKRELAKPKNNITKREAPETVAILDDLLKPQPQGTLFDAADARRVIEALQNPRFDKKGQKDGAAAEIVIRRLYDFLEKPDPKTVVAGPAAAAGATHKLAREVYAPGKRSQKLSRRMQKEERQAAQTASGKNVDNRLRAAAGWYLNELHPERRIGFTKEEIAALDQISKGTAGRNTLRWWGNFLGGGGGLGAQSPATIGAALGGTAGAVATGGSPLGAGLGALVGGALPLAAGRGLKGASNLATQRAMKAADELIRRRSPLFHPQPAEISPLLMRQTPLRGLAGAPLRDDVR